jgi:hypothetical protein
MTKATYVVLGSVMLFGTVLMIGAGPDSARGASEAGQNAMDIRAIESTIDLKALPNGNLDPAVYQ